mmetsp:Transcript_18088/g.25758  ORF Transcript_18088/g.25758 Transcript_18088/m.25758 type:complete len:319 (-) Transcript_18088:20-976(-)
MDLLRFSNYGTDDETEDDSDNETGCNKKEITELLPFDNSSVEQEVMMTKKLNRVSDDDCSRKNKNPRRDTSHGSNSRVVVFSASPDSNRRIMKNALLERTVPHIKGNWAGHIYVEPDPQVASTELLIKAVQKISFKFQTQLQLKLDDKIDDNPILLIDGSSVLHISLSKLFFLQLPSIPCFEELLKDRLAVEQAVTVTFTPATHLQVLLNDTETRTFLTSPAVAGSQGILRLIGAVDEVLKKYNQPSYYTNPNIHISILSGKGNQEKIFLDCINCIVLEDGDDNEQQEITISIDQVHCSLGTVKKISVPLNQSFKNNF